MRFCPRASPDGIFGKSTSGGCKNAAVPDGGDVDGLRRTLLGTAAAGSGLQACPAILRAQAPKVLKLSHQFPSGTINQGDARPGTIVRNVGQELEAFSFAAAKQDDEELARIYAARGAKVHERTPEHVETWRQLARETAWKDFSGKSARTAQLLKLAEQVS